MEEPDSPRRKNRDLEEAIQYFKSLSPDEKLRANVKCHLSLERIVNHSMSHGLNSDQIDDLMKVIVSTHHKLSLAIRSKLVKCLVPCSKVPQSAAVTAIITIGGKVFTSPGPNSLHSLLLRWLLLIYNYLDGFDKLHKLYNIIFNFIQSHLLLPHACHLLFLLTRRHDVKFYKVQQLLTLKEKLGPEPCVMGLLLIYKVYCPHLVTVKLDYGNKVFFKAHDKVWRQTILDTVGQQVYDTAEIDARKEKETVMPKSKQRKMLLPQMHDAAKEIEVKDGISRLSDKTSGIPFTQIDTFSDFLDNLDKIEYPSQIAAVLDSPRLQLYLSCNPDDVIMTRLTYWIQHILMFGFREKNKNDLETFENLLKMLLNFCQNCQSLPVIEGFLHYFLQTWDGETSAPIIYALVSNIPSNNFQDLFDEILQPLHQIFFSSDVYGKLMCVSSLTKLLRNKILHLNFERGHLGLQSNSEPTETDRPVSDIVSDNENFRASLMMSIPENIELLTKLVEFISDLVVLGLRIEKDHLLMQHGALDFLTVVGKVLPRSPKVKLPIETMHRLLLSGCPAVLARLCHITNVFRESVGNNQRDTFNGFIIDMVSVLLKGTMFTKKDYGKKYPSMFDVPVPPHISLPPDSLTIFSGPAFLGLATKFLNETQPEGKTVETRQIRKFKSHYLMFLEREGFPEFKKFFDFNLKKNRDKSTMPIELPSV